MCNYCGDEDAKYIGYCSVYCEYRDNEVVPRKKASITRFVQASKNLIKK